MQPAVALGVDLDLSKRGTDEFTDTKTRGVGEVQHEPKTLGGWRLPSIAPLQPFSHRLDQRPFAFPEHARVGLGLGA